MQPNHPICQSCGMPMTQAKLYGTDSDDEPTEKYCAYCFKSGAFVMPDATLEQMIEIAAKGWSDQDPEVSFEDAKAQMAQMLPQLERWRTA